MQLLLLLCVVVAACGEISASDVLHAGRPLDLGRGLRTIAVGDTARVHVRARSDASLDLRRRIAWRSLAPDIVAIEDGLLVAVAPGTATVIASLDGVDHSVDVTAVWSGVSLEGVAVAPREVTVPVGGRAPLHGTLRYDNGIAVRLRATLGWTVADSTVATVTRDGWLTAVDTGETWAVAVFGPHRDSVPVRVIEAPPDAPGLRVEPRSVTVTALADTFQLAVTLPAQRDPSSLAVDWMSTDPAIAVVDATGCVVARAPGIVAIVARVGAATDTALVTITPIAHAITVVPSALTVPAGESRQLAVALRDRNGYTLAGSVRWQTTSGTIDATGVLTAGVTPGVHRVIASTTDGYLADTAALTVTATALRQLAELRGFQIGAAVRDSAFRNDPEYRRTLATHYNSIVPEDATDFWPIHPAANRYEFGPADALADFATANDMAFHGHSLVWFAWIPTWVTAGDPSPERVRAILKDHITTVVGRYRGRAQSWDVVNEVIANEGCCDLQPSFWMDKLGPAYIDSAFVWAHRADPSAKLYLNDYATETINSKSTALLELATALRARGVPIHGVGFQMHILHFWPPPTSAQIRANLERFAAAGFDIRITELDVDIPDHAGSAALATQGATYAAVLDACLRVSRCIEMTTWGFTDRFSWIPIHFPGFGRALPFDRDYRPKPAVDSLMARLGRP